MKQNESSHNKWEAMRSMGSMLVGSMEKGWLCNYLLSFNLNSSPTAKAKISFSTLGWPHRLQATTSVQVGQYL